MLPMLRRVLADVLRRCVWFVDWGLRGGSAHQRPPRRTPRALPLLPTC